MKFAPDDLDGSMYRTLSSVVVPRPIAWVSSTSEAGVDNLAPYSFFNVACVAPPILMFAPGLTPEGLKDTARNAKATGEFVVNLVTADVAEAMNATSASLPADESEFDHADIARGETETVAPPRVADAAVSFECELYEFVDLPTQAMVLGEVVYAHIDDDLLSEAGKVDVANVDAVGRLAGEWYTHTRERFSMERP